MRNRLTVLLGLLLLAVMLSAQYDEKAILFQNAQQLTYQRQFSQAEQAWLQILQKYPNEVGAITQLFQLYLQMDKPDKAEQLLTDYRSVLPNNLRQEYDIQLDIQQAKLNSAWDKAQAYLQLNPNDETKYRLLANYFERKSFFEQSIRLYEQGRKALGRNDAFTMEIANSSFYSHQYDKAVTEYICYLEQQPGNIYFVSNQLSSILNENPDQLSQVKKLAQASISMDVKEVYAIALSRLGKLKEALAEYANLPTEKLSAFAYGQAAAGQDSLAIAAFNALRQREIGITTLGDILLKTSESQIRLRQFRLAETTLSEIINPVTFKADTRFGRLRYPFQALLLMSDLALWQGGKSAQITEILNAARKLAVSSDDQAEVDYRLIGNYFINQQYDEAEQLLAKLGSNKQQDRRLYYSFLISESKGQPELADTLLNQLIIAAPSSPYVNDVMNLNIMLMNLAKPAQTAFLASLQLRLSHRDSLAVQALLELSNTAKDEELRALAADWAIASGYTGWADRILNYEWKDELLKEYASLQRLKLTEQSAGAENMAQDFLRQNPDSVFSPGFRQVLQKSPAGRPNL
jgi:tetratricopeptide (TPR) repeat protein